MPAARLPTGAARALVRVTAPLLLSPRIGIAQQRRRADLSGRLMAPPRGTRVATVTLGDVAGERLSSPGARGGEALLFLHGGGYCIGSPRSHRALAALIAARSGLTAYVPDYRLAPEHPHPAALEDALSAYRALLETGVQPGRIAVAGDSAGGGLALALAMVLRDAGEPLPAVLALICPWLDLTDDHAGMRPAAPREPLLSPQATAVWARAYVGDADPADPAISPVHGDLEGLPPIVLSAAGDDLLAGDAERLADRASAAGIAIEHHRLDGLWHDIHTLAGLVPAADDAVDAVGACLRRRLEAAGDEPRVAIVGAGMSGLCMAHELKRAGLEDFTVYEKAGEVGGTWRENRYPGLTCDVPSRFYSYSFAPNPDWSSYFSPGAEIQRYFTRVTDELGLRRHIRFGAEIAQARWEEGRWMLRTRDGDEDVADVLVTATGVLHHPHVPPIEGLETFSGAAFHSARWDDSVELAGRRVAVIGTGSTGVQITTALAGEAGRLLVFQRTAQWILPVPNLPYSTLTRHAFRRLPWLNRLSYRVYQALLETVLGRAVTRPGPTRTLIGALCRLNLRLGVRDRELRRGLTPAYEPMCKRLVMSAGFYPAMQRDDVELVTEGIDYVEPRGIVTSDGRLHEADVIVLATGFDAHAYMRPMDIVGEDRLTLAEAWAEGPRAYRTVALPGFPNLFTLMGPHSPVGNHSLIAIAETQAAYVMQWIERLRRDGLASVAPTAAATARFNEELRRALPGTVWATGCRSWYLGADGRPELWPWSAARHREMLQQPEPADFVSTPAGRPEPVAR